MSFEQLRLIPPILRALQQEGYETPTPIQAQAIPLVLEGKDLLGSAQTGTGKTAAFSLPILQILEQKPRHGKGKRPIKALIMTPTRELAIQIGDSIKAYGKHLGLRHTVIFGGVSQKPQTDALRRGVDIVVATPGRLLDLKEQGFIDLRQLDVFVLDEADRMLDMGFIHDIRRIIALLPERRQSLFFSATMPPAIIELSDTILTDPAQVAVTPKATAAETVQQKLFYVEKSDKRSLLKDVLSDPNFETALVFTRTKYGADKVARFISKAVGVKAEAIHGNKSQHARQRALKNFKQQQTRVLVATDIAARGIDVEELKLVINFEIPNEAETYVHRIGRTGRAGSEGVALSFCSRDEQPYLKDIFALLKKPIPLEENHPFHISDMGTVDQAPDPPPPPRGKKARQGGGGGGRPKQGGGSNRPKRQGGGGNRGNSNSGNNPPEGQSSANKKRKNKRKKRWYGGQKRSGGGSSSSS